MDLFAAEIGMDPAEVRRKNLIPKFLEPHTTVDRPDLRRRRLRGRARQGARRRRLRRAARRAGRAAARPATPSSSASASASTSRSPAASPPFGEHAKIEVLDDGRAIVYTGTSPHGQGHVTAWAMLAHEQTGIPMDQIDARLGRHRPRARGRRHDGLALAAAGRRRRVTRRRSSSSSKAQQAGRRSCSRPTRPTSCSTRTPARSTSPARPPSPRPGPSSPSPPRPTATCRRSHTAYFAGRRRHVPVRRPRRRRRGRHRDRPGAAPAPRRLRRRRHACSTRCCSRARSTAASPRAPPRRCSRRSATTSDGNPITSNLADYAFISAAELPSFEVVHMETPDVRQPARRQGHRRVAARSARRRPCSRPSSTPSATSACATSTCPPPPNGSGAPSKPHRLTVARMRRAGVRHRRCLTPRQIAHVTRSPAP